MKERPKVSSGLGVSNIYFCLFGIVLINILAFPFFGIGKGYTETVFFIISNNEPLCKVLANISKATGYQIDVTKSWENVPITVDLKNSTLEDGIKQVISLLGNPNFALIKNESEKKVEIIISDIPPGFSSAGISNSVDNGQMIVGGLLHPSTALKRQNENTGLYGGTGSHFFDSEMEPPPDIVSPEIPSLEVVLPVLE